MANWVCQAWYWVANWVCQAWYWLSKWVCVVVLWIAKWVCVLLATIINAVWIVVTYLLWVPCKVVAPGTPKTDRIKHVFVVVLENRAFDHMLGFSGIRGTDARTGEVIALNGLPPGISNSYKGTDYPATTPADFAMPHDPGHEFNNVKEQLLGDPNGTYSSTITNGGFVSSYVNSGGGDDPSEVMKCFNPEQLPVLTALAREFALCDNWFASIPGPTWPNRFFLHAASSGGLDNSPSSSKVVSSTFLDGYKFENGTIYDLLDDEGFEWAVYKGDEFPQVLAISGMSVNVLKGRFHDFEDFDKDVKDPEFSPSYVFIEPNYGHTITHSGDMKCGTSQHPLDDVTRGERFLKSIYETIRNSPHWEESVLVITYDEHGGFFDHVHPPRAVAPGDAITDPDNNQNDFDFKQLGVRVPAIIVSPLIPRNLIDRTLYDHTSLLATAEQIFGLVPLTERDKAANNFYHLFSLPAPRTDAPTTLPDAAVSGIGGCDDDDSVANVRTGSTALALRTPTLSDELRHDGTPIDPDLVAFANIALRRELQIVPASQVNQCIHRFQRISTEAEAALYLHEVRGKIAEAKQANPTKFAPWFRPRSLGRGRKVSPKPLERPSSSSSSDARSID